MLADTVKFITLLDMPPDEEAEWNRRWEELMQDEWLHKKLDREMRFKEHIEYLDHFVPDFDELHPGTVIDIGPGDGMLLDIAGVIGHTTLGIDAPDGIGGMGNAYVEACTLVCERQHTPVVRCGGQHFFDRGHIMLPHMVGECAFINLRGSLEQTFCEFQRGVPHHVHHRCNNLAWNECCDTSGAVKKMFVWAKKFLRPGGLFLIHANGAQNTEYMDNVLQRCGHEVGFEVVHVATREHLWVKN